MTILYFYQYFSTPNGSFGTRVFEFSKRWAKKGDKIIVVTSIYDKSDLKASGISSKLNYEGVEVRVLNIVISNKYSFLYRIWTFFAYAILSSYYALVIKCDVIIASSGPITVGIPGLVGRYLRGRKLIFEVRDLWPEGAVQMGILNNKSLQKLAYAFEKWCYTAARKVVTLSPGMQNEIIQKYGFKHIESVTNASDNDVFGADTSSVKLPEWVAGKKIFLYPGNIGAVNNSWWVIKAAEILAKYNPEVLFLFIGDGQQRQEIENYIKEKEMENVKILPLMPKKDLVAFVQKSYFLLVPLAGKPILDTSSPNKLFDAFAAGIPVIQNTQGWIKELLANNNCGITIPADDFKMLADEIKRLLLNQELRDEMGRNAKRLGNTEFSRDFLAEKMHAIIRDVVNQK